MTTVGIDKSNQSIAYTLQQLYANKDSPDHMHIIYNDEHGCAIGAEADCKSDGYRAHAKGATVFNQIDGFWLIHSIPGFPPPDKYAYADKSKTYGQSIMCITFDTAKSMGELVEQWYRFHMSIYASRLPTAFAQAYPSLVEIVASNPLQAGLSVSRTASLKSKGGLQLTHFAKNKKWDQDLYADFVAPTLKSSMYAETWLRGLGDLKSGCPITDQTVWNVREVNPGNIRFGSGNDHSKWAVSQAKGLNYTCIGDINRQVSQFARGGGTMCFQDPDVWAAYSGSVSLRETCVAEGINGQQINGALETVAQPLV